MASSPRPGEITYYEELGVENTASPDQIRDSFRALARLLHPDQQTDPQLKDMAERQMRKLNRIHAVLADPTRRNAYNESLNSSRNAPIIVFRGSDANLKKLLARFSAFAVIVFAVFLVWFMATSNNIEVRGQETRGISAAKTTDTDGDAGEQISRLREQLRAAETERDSALEQLGRIARKQGDQTSDKSRGALSGSTAVAPEMADLTAGTAIGQMTTVASPAPWETEPETWPAQFTGLWVFSKSPGSAVSTKSHARYPPEFIQVTVTEVDGTLHGEYHSRYRVSNHAISPDVNFDFSCTPTGSSLNCPWRGPGGARGRLTLTLLPSSAVEIAWNATELGSEQWLSNGTATLFRK